MTDMGSDTSKIGGVLYSFGSLSAAARTTPLELSLIRGVTLTAKVDLVGNSTWSVDFVNKIEKDSMKERVESYEKKMDEVREKSFVTKMRR